LVNSAGITRDAFFVKQTYDTWDKVIKTNLYSVFNTCHLLIPHMKTKKFGRIINISSINAHGMIGQTNYSASKAGVEGFSKSLAQEVGKDNVTVNCIAPGYTQTDMLKTVPEIILKQVIDKTPMKRLGTVHDIAEAVLFLINASFITGTVLDVNGGLRT
jgi:acetoacetyl-CoA reductase